MTKYATVTGIASNDVFIGSERTEVIKMRTRFCWCKKCLAKDYKSCANSERCPSPTEHKVSPQAIDPFFEVENKNLSETGRKLASESKFGEYIVVETTDPSERFFICKNNSGTGDESCGAGPYTVEPGRGDYATPIDSINGFFLPGDEVIDVEKLEPLTPGSLTHVETDKCFPVHTTAVRVINLGLEPQVVNRFPRRKNRAPRRGLFQLAEADRDMIFSSLSAAATP